MLSIAFQRFFPAVNRNIWQRLSERCIHTYPAAEISLKKNNSGVRNSRHEGQVYAHCTSSVKGAVFSGGNDGISQSSISPDGKKLKIAWDDGHKSTFDVMWLRHNCQCPSCCFSSGQKLVEGRDLPSGMTITSTAFSGGHMKLRFADTPEGEHIGDISLPFLRKNCYSNAAIAHRRQQSTPVVATSIPQIDGSNIVEDDEVLWKWLMNLNEYGLCLLTNIPPVLGHIKAVAERVGHVPKTIYSQESVEKHGVFKFYVDTCQVFDVITTEDPVNIAYSPVQLNFHMDLVYYEAPPGLQLLHCIRFDPCVNGGESILLDTYPIMEELRQKHPEHFATLARVPATFQKVHYERAEPVEMTYQRPHIVLDRDTEKIIGVNWSPAFEGPLCVPEEDVELYYNAYRCLSQMFDTSNLKLTHRLQPGEVITISNRRILHRRQFFQLNGGVRHLQGVYVNIDEFKSKFRVLSAKFGKPGQPVRHVFNYDLL